jgi:hypothetical protein
VGTGTIEAGASVVMSDVPSLMIMKMREVEAQ